MTAFGSSVAFLTPASAGVLCSRGILYVVKQIPLTKGAFTIVDDDDYDELTRNSWHLSSTGYACRSVHIVGTRRHKTVWLHRHLLGVRNPRTLVDHANGNKLDNRRFNLRSSTKALNGANRGKPRHNTSGYKGVVKNGTGWNAQITVNGHNIYLGYFKTPELAALMYNAAAFKAFGSFAKLNEIPGYN